MTTQPVHVSPLSQYDARLLAERHKAMKMETIESYIEKMEGELLATDDRNHEAIYDLTLQIHYWASVKEARERINNA